MPFQQLHAAALREAQGIQKGTKSARSTAVKTLAAPPGSLNYTYYPKSSTPVSDAVRSSPRPQPVQQAADPPKQDDIKTTFFPQGPQPGATPYWFPEDSDYQCERDSMGLCIVDPVLSESSGAQHEDVGLYYEMQEKLGEGSFGVVYAARSRQTGENVACKSIKKIRLDGGTKIEAIRQEVRIMQLVCGHRNVINIRGAYEDEEYVHIVMDLCRGGHLLEWLERHGPLDERTAARVTFQMAHMLNHCHELNVMHRDVKPENFLLTSDNIHQAELKATDFGLSKFYADGEKYNADCGGSPYYIAPEVIEGKFDAKSDIWGLGVTLYECLSGSPPFLGTDAGATGQVFDAICMGHLDLHSGSWRYVSDGAKDLIMWMLNRDPKSRASALDVLKHPWLRDEHTRQGMQAANDAVLLEIDLFSQIDSLKQLLLRVVGRCLPHREVLGAERMFQVMDTDNDGSITVNDLKAIARRGHWALTREEMDRSVRYAEASSRDGKLTFDDFVATTLSARHLNRDLLVRTAFRHLDADGSGAICPKDLSKTLNQLGMSAEGVEELMYASARNGTGQITYERFVELVRETRADAAATEAQGEKHHAFW